MHRTTTSMTKRLGAAIAAAVVLFVMAMPAAAVCCVGTGDRTASMQASMPCCNESCTMSSPKGDRDHDVAVAADPSPEVAAGADAGVVVVAPATAGSTVATCSLASEHARINFSPPPPFLVHSQFRI
jgi:hypothetical protein